MRASGCSACHASPPCRCRCRARRRRSCMFSATPCTSDLWLMSGESIFSATGKPSCVAIIIASLALRASMVCVTGMWKAASSALRLHLGQHLAALGQHAFDQQARAFDVGLGQRRTAAAASAAAAAGSGRSWRCCRRRPPPPRACGSSGCAASLSSSRALAHRGVAHPAAPAAACRSALEARPARCATPVGVDVGLGRVDHQHAVDCAVVAPAASMAAR